MSLAPLPGVRHACECSSLEPQLKKTVFRTRCIPPTQEVQWRRAWAPLRPQWSSTSENLVMSSSVGSMSEQHVLRAGAAEPDGCRCGAPVGVCDGSERVARGTAAALRNRRPRCDASSARRRGRCRRGRLHPGRKGSPLFSFTKTLNNSSFNTPDKIVPNALTEASSSCLGRPSH